MAVVELVDPDSPGASADQTLADGERATIIPRPASGSWKVEVQIKDSDDVYHTMYTLPDLMDYKQGIVQIIGPQTFRVSTRNAGADADLPESE